jgi:hypothetical protein
MTNQPIGQGQDIGMIIRFLEVDRSLQALSIGYD